MKKLLLLLSLVASKALAVEVSQESLDACAEKAAIAAISEPIETASSLVELTNLIQNGAKPSCSVMAKLISAREYTTNNKTLMQYFHECMENNAEQSNNTEDLTVRKLRILESMRR